MAGVIFLIQTNINAMIPNKWVLNSLWHSDFDPII